MYRSKYFWAGPPQSTVDFPSPFRPDTRPQSTVTVGPAAQNHVQITTIISKANEHQREKGCAEGLSQGLGRRLDKKMKLGPDVGPLTQPLAQTLGPTLFSLIFLGF